MFSSCRLISTLYFARDFVNLWFVVSRYKQSWRNVLAMFHKKRRIDAQNSHLRYYVFQFWNNVRVTITYVSFIMYLLFTSLLKNVCFFSHLMSKRRGRLLRVGSNSLVQYYRQVQQGWHKMENPCFSPDSGDPDAFYFKDLIYTVAEEVLHLQWRGCENGFVGISGNWKYNKKQ